MVMGYHNPATPPYPLPPVLPAVLITIGQMKGQTLLPLPPQSTMPSVQPEQGMKDQDKIHILESAIVTWTKQIKNVLKADPDAPLKVRCTVHGVACISANAACTQVCTQACLMCTCRESTCRVMHVAHRAPSTESTAHAKQVGSAATAVRLACHACRMYVCSAIAVQPNCTA